jgi:hypothetical protein
MNHIKTGGGRRAERLRQPGSAGTIRRREGDFSGGGRGEGFRGHKPEALILTVGLAGLFALPVSSAQAQTDTNAVPPTFAQRMTSIMNQQYMLGDWGGERSRLADEGCDL